MATKRHRISRINEDPARRLSENGEDMTHMTAPQKLATTSSFKVDIFSTTGEFYPVDTYQVKTT